MLITYHPHIIAYEYGTYNYDNPIRYFGKDCKTAMTIGEVKEFASQYLKVPVKDLIVVEKKCLSLDGSVRLKDSDKAPENIIMIRNQAEVNPPVEDKKEDVKISQLSEK